MKSTIIFLGLVALNFTNAKAATVFETQFLDMQESATVIVKTSNNAEVCSDTDTVIFNPNSVIKTACMKTTEDIIAENKLITESKELPVQPLSIATTIEDRIAEDNEIIESTVSNEVFPLDFDKINRKTQCVKVYTNTAAIPVDLKL